MSKELKTETLNLRVSLGTKLALKGIADRENRSMVNVLECLVNDYYRRNNIELPLTTSSSL
ncbi:hypothetical protein FJY94_09315 [Candidatus Kaiserbacteria bacterium]|nr:hypothetical protein [Candidatus Kaiserbacteria bacterium]